MEIAFGELRAAHDLIRLNHSRFAYAGSEAPSAHSSELKHLVTRAERASFEYRLSVREYVERMCVQPGPGATRTARTPQPWGHTEPTPAPAREPLPVTAPR